METRGKFSSKMLRKCNHWQKHFDENFNFLCHYPNKNVKEPSFKKIQVSITPERELMNLLKKHSPAEEGTK